VTKQLSPVPTLIRYDVALSHTDNPEHRMAILRAQADHYYGLKKFELAASL
jgi:hypothetical protein